MNRADRLIQDLRLEEHPKGGWYMRLLLPCLATLACAAAEGIPETERLNAAIAELAASPPAAAYRALSRRISGRCPARASIRDWVRRDNAGSVRAQRRTLVTESVC